MEHFEITITVKIMEFSNHKVKFQYLMLRYMVHFIKCRFHQFQIYLQLIQMVKLTTEDYFDYYNIKEYFMAIFEYLASFVVWSMALLTKHLNCGTNLVDHLVRFLSLVLNHMYLNQNHMMVRQHLDLIKCLDLLLELLAIHLKLVVIQD